MYFYVDSSGIVTLGTTGDIGITLCVVWVLPVAWVLLRVDPCRSTVQSIGGPESSQPTLKALSRPQSSSFPTPYPRVDYSLQTDRFIPGPLLPLVIVDLTSDLWKNLSVGRTLGRKRPLDEGDEEGTVTCGRRHKEGGSRRGARLGYLNPTYGSDLTRST